MARQKEFVPEQVLEKAMLLFWKQGYEGSSIEDIMQCTGLGRGSLYDTFGDKHSLYLASLDLYCSTGKEGITTLRNQTGSLRESLQSFFQIIIEEAVTDTEHRGCFMVNAAQELAPHDPEVAQRVRAGIDETTEAFYHILIKAQISGELPWTYDPHQLAHFLLNTLLGMRVLSRGYVDRHMLQGIVATALSLFV